MGLTVPTVYHFTRVEHLPTIVQHGLLSDCQAQGGLLKYEVGNRGIKTQRSRRKVPVYPFGVVADYVPFYFGPRSPMMYAIAQGNVPDYAEGTGRIVYLVSDVDRLSRECRVIVSDRNAALQVARFGQPSADLFASGFIDWDVIEAPYWTTFADGRPRTDGRERRMAECLAHECVPWPCVTQVVAKSAGVAAEARALVASAVPEGGVVVRTSWYF